MAVDQLDLAVIGAYLEDHVAGFRGLRAAKKFADGQSNPTFLLTADSGQYVLRRQPPGELLQSAHAVDREYRVMSALANSDVPVPRTFHLCEDRNVIGSLFFVMEFMAGRLFWNPALPELDSARRGAMYAEMNRVLAALHNVDAEAAGLADYGYPGNYFERQVSRWSKQYLASETEPIAAMHELMEWLPANAPADDGQVSLIHGDYRIDNLIYAPGAPDVRAILDWELSTLGDPLADFSYLAMNWALPRTGKNAQLGGLDLDELGIPPLEVITQRYCQATGRTSVPDMNWYFAYNLFRLVGILQGIKKRIIDGNASSKDAQKKAAMVEPLAMAALDFARKAGA